MRAMVDHKISLRDWRKTIDLDRRGSGGRRPVVASKIQACSFRDLGTRSDSNHDPNTMLALIQFLWHCKFGGLLIL